MLYCTITVTPLICYNSVMLTNRNTGCNTGKIMYVSLTEAAKKAGVSRATLYKRHREGKLSFHRNETGQQVIDMAELSRLYTLPTDTLTNCNTPKHDDLTTQLWETKLEAAQEKIVLLERHIDTLQNTLQREQEYTSKLLVTSEKQRLTNEQKPQTWWQRVKKAMSEIPNNKNWVQNILQKKQTNLDNNLTLLGIVG